MSNNQNVFFFIAIFILIFDVFVIVFINRDKKIALT